MDEPSVSTDVSLPSWSNSNVASFPLKFYCAKQALLANSFKGDTEVHYFNVFGKKFL